MYTYGRKEIDLCGKWGFYPDPFERGLRQKWYEKQRGKSSVFPCYDDYSRTAVVPHAWNAHETDLKYYDGTCMYLREFQLENAEKIKEENNAWLCFDGVNYHAEIYLNGQLVGIHEGGYSPFQMNITPYLAEHNRLWVAVNNRNAEDRVPSVIYDWWNDGGIFRPVKVVFTPKAFIKNFKTETRINGDKAELGFSVWIEGEDCQRVVPYTIFVEELGIELSGETTPGSLERKEVILSLNGIELWCPENPKLYKIDIRTDEDSISDEVGFREIRAEGSEILLNGKPIFLKGINFHDDYKESGRAPKSEYIDEAIAAFKDLGLNFIRLSHYPHIEELVKKADREGFLLWAEIPVYWYVYWKLEGVYETAERMMLEMIDRDQNRASVVIWSVGNEMPKVPGNEEYLIKLVEATRKADDTRLISYACSWFEKDEEGNGGRPGLHEDFYGALDVISINDYSGNNDWGKPEDMEYIINGYASLGKPVMMSEFGSFSKRGYNCSPEDAESEESQVKIFTEELQVILRNPYIRGISPWSFQDNRTPLYHMKRAQGIARYGITDENWRPKKVYNVYKDVLSKISR